MWGPVWGFDWVLAPAEVGKTDSAGPELVSWKHMPALPSLPFSEDFV